jgi:hypothetical protein
MTKLAHLQSTATLSFLFLVNHNPFHDGSPETQATGILALHYAPISNVQLAVNKFIAMHGISMLDLIESRSTKQPARSIPIWSMGHYLFI